MILKKPTSACETGKVGEKREEKGIKMDGTWRQDKQLTLQRMDIKLLTS